MAIKISNALSLTPLTISSHADVQLGSDEPLTAVLTLHWLRPRSIDAEITTTVEKTLKRDCNCMERPKTLVVKLNTVLKSPINPII